MKSLLLLDADIIIDMHKFNYWEGLIKNYIIYLPSTILTEAMHYFKNGNKIPINLQPCIDNGVVVVVSATANEQQIIFNKLQVGKVDAIHSGELEALTFMSNTDIQDLKMGLKDHAAIRASAFLKLSERTVSIETFLQEKGLLRQKENLPTELTESRFRQYTTEGLMLLMEGERK